MKKFLVFVACSSLTASAWAASDCVTRVDKNLDKTTAEKIEFCLTEEVETPAETPTTEVIFSDTHEVQYPQSKSKSKKQKNKQVQSTKKKNAKKRSSATVSTEYYEVSEYPAFRNDVHPRQSAEDAHEVALEALRGQNKPAKKSAAKPKRKIAKEQKQKIVQEVKQAQAIENDPIVQNPTDNDTVPAGFLDDGVMGPADFGYNATDPALQP